MPRLDAFSALIRTVDTHARIVLNSQVMDIEQLEPLISFLERNGITADQFKIDYASTAASAFQVALAKGLRASRLNFGGDVAERDMGLTRYFVTTHSYEAVRAHRRHIVIGPKGSGKTAILRTLQAISPQSLVITPEHYATEMLHAILQSDSSGELQAFITTWKYTLLVEIFKSVVATQGADARSLAAIRKYLVDHGHLSSELTIFERFVRYFRKIKEVRGTVAGASIGVGLSNDDELRKLFKMEELLDLVPKLQSVLRKRSFAVLIDELDQSWDNTTNANNFLVSLVMAAIYLNGLDPNLHVVIFIRSEIFDLIKGQLSQLDKLRSDIEELSWRKEELGRLVVGRVLNSLDIKSGDDLPAKEVLQRVFAQHVASTGLDGIGYIISRTSRRPREVIQFCALALDVAISLEAENIDEQSILRAEESFSRWKREHISSEYLYIYPDLDYLMSQFRGRSVRMSYREMDDLLTTATLDAQDMKRGPEWMRAAKTTTDVLRILYQVEAIGVERLNSSGLDPRRPWEAYDFSFARPEARPEDSPSFLFHPALWQSLELRP